MNAVRTPGEERLLTGRRWLWLLVVLAGGLVGALIYLAVGQAAVASTGSFPEGPPGTARQDSPGRRAASSWDVRYLYCGHSSLPER